MAVKEFSWKSAENVKIYAAEWPAENAKAVIGLIHGIGEHCRRYDHVGAFFQEHQIAMIGYDRQGYGRSEGRRGDVEKFSYYYDEVAKLMIECERRYPDRPVFLYGHSMGGNVLLNYIIRRRPNIVGAIISAPHIGLNFKPNPIVVGMGRVMRNIWPTFTQENQLDLSHLSRSPEVAPAYAADPLTHSKLSARTGIDILDAADHLNNWTGSFRIAILLTHGDEDAVTSFEATKAFAQRETGPDITFKPWPGLYHELHNEPEKQQFFDFLLSWLTPRIESAHSERKLKSV